MNAYIILLAVLSLSVAFGTQRTKIIHFFLSLKELLTFDVYSQNHCHGTRYPSLRSKYFFIDLTVSENVRSIAQALG